MENNNGDKKNISTLVVIIVMLLISVPSAIYGMINHKSNTEPEKPVETNKFKYDGKLHFYMAGNLFYEYTCKSEDCDYAPLVVDDNAYNLNYYKDTELEKLNHTLQMRNVFLYDNDEIFFLSFSKPDDTITFEAIKNYGIGLAEDYIIVKSDGKWGVVKVTLEGLEEVIPCEYDYIGVPNEINEEELLDSSSFAVFKLGEGWNIISNTGTKKLVNPIPSIVNYDDYTIIVKGDTMYSAYDYHDELLYSGLLYSDVIAGYIIVVSSDKSLYVYASSEPTRQIGATEKIEVDFSLTDLPITYSVVDGKLKMIIRSTSGDPKIVVY